MIIKIILKLVIKGGGGRREGLREEEREREAREREEERKCERGVRGVGFSHWITSNPKWHASKYVQ